MFLKSIDTMFSGFIIALLCGDIVTQLVMVVAFLTHPFSDWMTFLLVCTVVEHFFSYTWLQDLADTVSQTVS